MSSRPDPVVGRRTPPGRPGPTRRIPAPEVAALGDPASTLSVAGGRRRPTWVLTGVLLVGLASLLGAWILSSVDQRISVLVAGRDLDPGHVLTVTDLRVVEIGRTDQLRAIQPDQQDLVLGHPTRGPVPAGTVLNTDLFTGRDQAVPPGQAVVAAALDPGAAPLGLRPGDAVRLFVAVRVSGGQAAVGDAAVLGVGTVWSVDAAGASVPAKLSISVLVAADLQQRAVQAAYEGTLRLSLAGSTP